MASAVVLVRDPPPDAWIICVLLTNIATCVARPSELNQKAKHSKREAEEYKRLYEEALNQQKPTQTVADPYAGMSAEEKEQTRAFIDKFVLPEVQKRYEPFVREVKTERLNKQVSEAKEFASKFGINFDQKLPEIVDYLSRPENQIYDPQTGHRIGGRLNATEAVRNLYFDEITSAVKNKTAEELQKQKDELMEKKKQANMQPSSAAPASVVQSEEMARRQMKPAEKLSADIKDAIDKARRGERNPKVKTASGDGLYEY